MRFDRLTNEGLDTGVGKRYWLDLRLIRETKGIEIGIVHERTRVPLEVLASFERRGFSDRKRFNSVYRRSLVAAYARAIDINPDDALRSAEETDMGRYNGRLAREYLGVETAAPANDLFARTPPAEERSEESVQDPVETSAGAAKGDEEVNAAPRVLFVVTAIVALMVVVWLIVALT